jgi:ribosomal protein L11 methyltransferase
VLRARFVELAPEGFEEVEGTEAVELAAYGAAGERVLAEFPGATVTEVEAGWEVRWREFHRPVQIGPLWIGPPWESRPSGTLAVVIDPGRAFGTGAHPTTRLCLELLLELSPGSLLDIGCGSGVLSIAAARLGFAPVWAGDSDAAAVEATVSNAAANGVVVQACVLDALSRELPAAETAVANIALAAVETLAPLLVVERVITSGYLARDEPLIAGFQHAERRERDGWAADLHLRA